MKMISHRGSVWSFGQAAGKGESDGWDGGNRIAMSFRYCSANMHEGAYLSESLSFTFSVCLSLKLLHLF